MSFFAKLGGSGSDTDSDSGSESEESLRSGDEGEEQDRQIAAKKTAAVTKKAPAKGASRFLRSDNEDSSDEDESESEEELSEDEDEDDEEDDDRAVSSVRVAHFSADRIELGEPVLEGSGKQRR